MLVSVEWHTFSGDRFEPDGEVLQIEARETPKVLFVQLPGGYLARIKKYNRRNIGRFPNAPRSSHVMYYGYSTRRKIRFNWDPAEYAIPMA